jgi:hypothetical protein
MVEGAVLLIDHDDVVDLFAQPLEVGRNRSRRPERGEARGEECGSSSRRDGF